MVFEDKKYVYVVEGITDEDKLKKLGAKYVVITGGKFIRSEITSFLVNVSENRKLIILTDPDTPGKNIAQYLKSKIDNCTILHAKQSLAHKGKKIGIAQMSLDNIKIILEDYLNHDSMINENEITPSDFVSLGLIGEGGKKERYKLINKYSIPFTSGKKVIDAVNMLSLTLEDIKKDIENEWTRKNQHNIKRIRIKR